MLVREKKVYSNYLKYRQQILQYTDDDMNLRLDNDNQVYIALFDIPVQSNIIGFQTQSLALIFGLNTILIHGSGEAITELEKNVNVKKAMQSILVSSSQVLPFMKLSNDIEFYNSDYIRVYLKTSKGVYFKELNKKTNENSFIKMMLDHVLNEIARMDQLI